MIRKKGWVLWNESYANGLRRLSNYILLYVLLYYIRFKNGMDDKSPSELRIAFGGLFLIPTLGKPPFQWSLEACVYELPGTNLPCQVKHAPATQTIRQSMHLWSNGLAGHDSQHACSQVCCRLSPQQKRRLVWVPNVNTKTGIFPVPTHNAVTETGSKFRLCSISITNLYH